MRLRVLLLFGTKRRPATAKRFNRAFAAALAVLLAIVPCQGMPPKAVSIAGTWVGSFAGTGLGGRLRFTLNPDGSLDAGDYILPGVRRFHLTITGTWTQFGENLEIRLQTSTGDLWRMVYEVLGRSTNQLIVRAANQETVLWRRAP